MTYPQERAERAARLLRDYGDTRHWDEPDTRRAALLDLLGDLLHWAGAERLPFDTLLDEARRRHEEDTAE
jgi:hypothetical protein